MSLNDRVKLLEQCNNTFNAIYKIRALKDCNENEALEHCKYLQLKLTDNSNVCPR